MTRANVVGNTADLTAWAGETLARLLPAGCQVGGMSTAALPGQPLPTEEWIAVKSACPERQAEFAAGRIAARSALRALGEEPSIIPTAPDRSPSWPAGIVGSIAHTQGIALAAVAHASAIVSIGIDIEATTAVKPELWPQILAPEEIEFISHLPAAAALRTAAVIFTTKEAFYKFQHPLTKRWLDFHDAWVRVDHEGQRCEIHVRQPILVGRMPVTRFESRFAIGPVFTVSGIASLRSALAS